MVHTTSLGSAITPANAERVGVVVGACLSGGTPVLVALAPQGRMPGALDWAMGDLGMGTPRRVAVLFPYVAL